MNGWIRLQQMKHWGLKCKMQGVYLICYSFKMKICSLTWISNFPVLRYVRPLQLGLFPEQWNKWKTASLPGNTLAHCILPAQWNSANVSSRENHASALGLCAKELVMTSNKCLKWQSKALWILTQVLMCLLSTRSNLFKECLKKIKLSPSLSTSQHGFPLITNLAVSVAETQTQMKKARGGNSNQEPPKWILPETHTVLKVPDLIQGITPAHLHAIPPGFSHMFFGV